MIRLENVTRRYGETVAVNGLSLQVEKGEVCVLIGPSGCGKTTTLRMVNRLIQPTSGRIFIDGRDTDGIRSEELRRSIGYAIQNVGLFPHMTVAENVGVVPELLHWDKDRKGRRVEELLRLVNLNPAEYSTKYPAQLSGGEAQRIGVARALAADPPILLMDEPFGAVDPLTRERLQDQFAAIQSGLKKTVILVTHDLDEAIRLADRIAIMESGRLVQYDTPEAVLARPANRFVHDFVGADRALKRLSRIGVKDFIRLVLPIRLTATKEAATAALGDQPSLWVVEEDGKLAGWLTPDDLTPASSVAEATTRGNMEEICILTTATLREALARMLGQGMKNIPVVDEDKIFIGEVTLADIETATAEISE